MAGKTLLGLGFFSGESVESSTGDGDFSSQSRPLDIQRSLKRSSSSNLYHCPQKLTGWYCAAPPPLVDAGDLEHPPRRAINELLQKFCRHGTSQLWCHCHCACHFKTSAGPAIPTCWQWHSRLQTCQYRSHTSLPRRKPCGWVSYPAWNACGVHSALH